MKNSADQGGCYPQWPKAEVDNTLPDLQNSSYPTNTEFNNCFIIHSKYFPILKEVSSFRSLFFRSPKIAQSFGFLGQRFNNLAGCTFDVIGSIWQRLFSNLVNSSWLW